MLITIVESGFGDVFRQFVGIQVNHRDAEITQRITGVSLYLALWDLTGRGRCVSHRTRMRDASATVNLDRATYNFAERCRKSMCHSSRSQHLPSWIAI